MENDTRYVEEVDLDSIDDEKTLQQMLEETEDFDERKMIRARLREIQTERRAKMDEMMRKREQDRDETVKKRLQEAEDQKKRTLAMYDQMAKSAPAGGKKVMDINIYKNADRSSGSSGTATPTGPTRDLVEDAIRQRQKDAEDRKKRILAAFDAAARSGPAGSEREVNFQAFKAADVSEYVPPMVTGRNTEESCATFGVKGGIPVVKKGTGSTPSTPLPGGMVIFPKPRDDEANLDPMERAIRKRQREADERKKRTLAAYDIIAKTGDAGPKVVCLEEFRDLQVSDAPPSSPKVTATSAFRGGVHHSATGFSFR